MYVAPMTTVDIDHLLRNDDLLQLLDAAEQAGSLKAAEVADVVELGGYHRDGGEQPLELFLVTDYPLTQEVIQDGVPRVVRRADPGADPAEAALLERLGYDSLLMLPLSSHRQSWGLVEIYGDDRVFEDDEIATAASIVDRVGELLAVLEHRV